MELAPAEEPDDELQKQGSDNKNKGQVSDATKLPDAQTINSKDSEIKENDRPSDGATPAENNHKSMPTQQDQAEEGPLRSTINDTKDEAELSGNSLPAYSDTRESRIRALIVHRKLLLRRIELCRAAAENRLDQGSNKATKENDKSKVEKLLIDQPSTKGILTDDDELAAFREMTRLANQTAKKGKSEGEGQGSAEKRTSLSLRRGSSVGKRMNAALSSLAPRSWFYEFDRRRRCTNGSNIDQSTK